jgi:gamma-glutamyltranspeptidase/glutathione hydrolase
MGGGVAGAAEVMAEQQTGRGSRGVVAAAAPLAAALGAEAMRDGGNAYDGAVVAALAETALLPPKCGLGGDLVAIVLPSGASEPECLLAIGGAPDALPEAARRGRLAETGPTSVGVPSAPAGYDALSARGRLGRDRQAAPAARVAEDGVVWAPICRTLGEESHALAHEHEPGGSVYFPDGRPLRAGEVVRLPGQARALRAWAADGAGCLAGDLGTAIVDRVAAAGGLLTSDDLRHARAEWVAPAHAACHGHEVWTTPAPTHGPSMLDAIGRTDPRRPQQLWAATQAAIADRRARLGEREDGGTSMVTAVDADGTIVVVVHSNSYPRFGSGLVVHDFDLILNNRAGRGFTAREGHPNFPVAGRRPATTLMAWAAGPAGKAPSHLGATPGGANQMTWNAQLVSTLLAGERDPGRLVTAPRWEWLPEDDGVRVEEDLPTPVRAAVAAGATRTEVVPRWGLRCAQQVAVRPDVGSARVAAVDPRTGGAVSPV